MIKVGHHYIMRRGMDKKKIVDILVERPVTIDSKSGTPTIGWTPLHFAAINGHEAVINLLCDRKANTEAKDNYGWEPWHFAIFKGHSAVAEKLSPKIGEGKKDNKANMDASRLRWTPLHCAAINEHHTQAVEFLDEANGYAFQDVWTALDWATGKGQLDVIRLFLDDRKVNLKDHHGLRLLSLAVTNGQVAVIQMLIDQGADLDSKDQRRRTPLSRAAEEGRDEVVRLLLDQGADVEPRMRLVERHCHGRRKWAGKRQPES